MTPSKFEDFQAPSTNCVALNACVTLKPDKVSQNRSLSLGDVSHPNQQIDLYGDQIAF